MKYCYTYDTPIGQVVIAEKKGKICNIDSVQFYENEREDFVTEETDLIKKAAKELEEYFQGSRTEFDLPLLMEGTEFQIKVWKALTEIPYGCVWTYKRLAEHIGCPKGYRAVGNANNKNKLLIVVPCHRVIGSNGSLVGFARGLDVKKQLLYIEKK